MHCQKPLFTLIILCLLVSAGIQAQKTGAFPVSTPEAEGVSSAGIINFLDAAAKSKTEFHSFMFLRHGKLVAEGWWNPYSPTLKHTLYSTSKSFTAAAVGFAISEKKVSLDDKVVNIFPNDLPPVVGSNLGSLTVKDVLMMSDGQDPDPTGTLVRDTNWVKAFLSTTIVNKPGTKFLYNSMGTYMLSAIVQKVTGKKVIDYLKPRLFEPLGIKGMDWEVSPQGINTGGWGLRLKTEDMAKFGQLYLQKGMWNGKQVIPAAWVQEATTMKIMQDPSAPQSKKDSSDWLQGYCYQMWRCRHNAVRADGAFGQYIIMMPDQDAVIAITAETPDMQEEINLVWQYLLPAMHDGALPEDNAKDEALRQKTKSLALVPPVEKTIAVKAAINGKTFTLQPNNLHINEIAFSVKNGNYQLTIKNDTANYTLNFGEAKWQTGETSMHGPYLLTGAVATLTGLPAFKTAGSYDWKDAQTLELLLRYIESPHTETLLCHFDGNNISIDVKNSYEYGKGGMVLKGVGK
jgi:CubicO group peptidase (beta-lactamase class C family)